MQQSHHGEVPAHAAGRGRVAVEAFSGFRSAATKTHSGRPRRSAWNRGRAGRRADTIGSIAIWRAPKALAHSYAGLYDCGDLLTGSPAGSAMSGARGDRRVPGRRGKLDL